MQKALPKILVHPFDFKGQTVISSTITVLFINEGSSYHLKAINQKVRGVGTENFCSKT